LILSFLHNSAHLLHDEVKMYIFWYKCCYKDVIFAFPSMKELMIRYKYTYALSYNTAHFLHDITKHYLKGINFPEHLILRVEKSCISRALNFANGLIFYCFLWVNWPKLHVNCEKAYFASIKFRELTLNSRNSRNLMLAKINPLKVYRIS